MTTDGIGLIAARPLLDGSLDVTFRLLPGDRPLVAAGESVVAGTPIAERLRDPRLTELAIPAGSLPMVGRRVAEGELLFEWRGRWRVATGDMTEPIETPVAGIVRDVRPGSAIVISASGQSMRGIVALGGPTHGRLRLLGGGDADVRASSLDVGMAGAILVVGSRLDAETLTRARAMGVRGIIVAGLASKERRDFLGSERRQRAALHRLPPFAVLVLEGALRRPLAGPMMDVLGALIGQEVAIVQDPPALVFDTPGVEVPRPATDRVRVRSGDLAGREGTWLGALGPRRFAGGVHLEAGAVRFGDGRTQAIPIGDLERFT